MDARAPAARDPARLGGVGGVTVRLVSWVGGVTVGLFSWVGGLGGGVVCCCMSCWGGGRFALMGCWGGLPGAAGPAGVAEAAGAPADGDAGGPAAGFFAVAAAIRPADAKPNAFCSSDRPDLTFAIA